jgi:hypothetical protein
MIQKITTAFLFIFLLFACVKDNGQRLFEMVYPNIQFTIPPGLNSFLPRVFEVPTMKTNINFYLKENNMEIERVKAISPYSARISALDNFDYDFVREISIRVCPIGNDPCTPADEVFYIDNIQRRAGNRVDLLPTLRNAKPILSIDRFKLEVLFFFDTTTPYSVDSRLDMTFEAVE